MDEHAIILRDYIITEKEFEDFSVLDEFKIDKIISVAPTIIASTEALIVAKEQERFNLHQEYKREFARKRLEAKKLKGEDKLSNEKDREAWALIQGSVIEAMQKEVNCVTDIKNAKVKQEFWRNQFIAARKLANKIEKQMELDIQSSRFNT